MHVLGFDLLEVVTIAFVSVVFLTPGQLERLVNLAIDSIRGHR